MTTWNPITTAPENKLVMTKVDDADGCRNEQAMSRSGNLWFAGDTYVYYTPTHWRELTDLERMKMKNQAEAKLISAFERTAKALGY